MEININHKKFVAVENSANGEVSPKTLFHYRQKGTIIWATYEGGAVLFGTLSGYIADHEMVFTYQHQNLNGEFLTGTCETKIEVRNHKIRLIEKWQWTCKDFSKGTSILEEL